MANLPLLLGSVLGFVGAAGHFFGGGHIPQMLLKQDNPALQPIEVAFIGVAWNVVATMMVSMSVIQLYLALLPRSEVNGGRKAILRVCAFTWLMNSVTFIRGVGTQEIAPWMCMAQAVLVAIGSL